jgi:hypothetical protein
MIFSYNKWSILNAPIHVDFKAPIDTKVAVSICRLQFLPEIFYF